MAKDRAGARTEQRLQLALARANLRLGEACEEEGMRGELDDLDRAAVGVAADDHSRRFQDLNRCRRRTELP